MSRVELNRPDVDSIILSRKIRGFLEEDLGFGDITTAAVIKPEIRADARIICREDAVVAGVEEAALTFSLLDCSAHSLVKDGESVRGGRTIMEVGGRASAILKGERTALNLLGRMSGVATATRRLVDEAAKVDPKIRVAATRKTLPGFGVFDKRAVHYGGGDTHRFRLDDEVLIKDNHIRVAGSIGAAVEAARKAVSFTKKIEAEASSLKEAVESAEAGADIVMLDNMGPKEMSQVVATLKKKRLREKVLLEASGNITADNIGEFCKAGVDVVSSGSITHSAKNVDFTLKIAWMEKVV